MSNENDDLVRRLGVAADGIEKVSFDRRSIRRGYENLLREAATALARRPILSDEAVERAMAAINGMAGIDGRAVTMIKQEAYITARLALTAAFSPPPEPRPMTGILSGLTPEQREAALTPVDETVKPFDLERFLQDDSGLPASPAPSYPPAEQNDVTSHAVPSSPVPVEAVGWQPIETAPKDGTRFLAFSHSQVVVARWGDGPYNRSTRKYTGGWSVGMNSNAVITHWMPLPAAPAHREVGE